MSEAISYGDSFQPSQETFVVFSLSQYLLADSWSVFATIALSKNKQRMLSFDSKFLETSIGVLIQLSESFIEIICQLSHIGHIGLRIAGVGVAESCSHWLVNKNNIVVSDPRIFIANDIESFRVT